MACILTYRWRSVSYRLYLFLSQSFIIHLHLSDSAFEVPRITIHRTHSDVSLCGKFNTCSG